ncbi:hypothetical protein B0H63DRAFT_68947 [Podospora didyma]|uniref:Uncharacterized protein n=1 Tax=Podospora didyma TaxID=330526 RepID=A0AAE0K149_9PEZI|nr:hypothetical protein B0H63DRAFT_68947 [Podospora didyma]
MTPGFGSVGDNQLVFCFIASSNSRVQDSPRETGRQQMPYNSARMERHHRLEDQTGQAEAAAAAKAQSTQDQRGGAHVAAARAQPTPLLQALRVGRGDLSDVLREKRQRGERGGEKGGGRYRPHSGDRRAVSCQWKSKQAPQTGWNMGSHLEEVLQHRAGGCGVLADEMPRLPVRPPKIPAPTQGGHRHGAARRHCCQPCIIIIIILIEPPPADHAAHQHWSQLVPICPRLHRIHRQYCCCCLPYYLRQQLVSKP